MKPKTNRRMLGNLGAILVALVIALVIGEVALRLMGFSFRLYPERIEFGWPDPVTLEDKFRADPDLLWVPKDYDNTLAAARQSPPRLIFMGDSCTQYGRYDTYLIQRLAAAAHGEAPPFANLGVGGWSSYQGLQQLERDVVPLHPRVITIYYGWNDHWRGFGVEDKEVARVSRSLLRKLDDLRLAQLVSKAVMVVKQDDGGGEPLRRVSPSDFRHNLERMVEIARANGIVPVLVTAPSSHVAGAEPGELEGRFLDDLTELVPLHQRYVDIVRDVAATHNVILADLTAEFETMPPDLVRYSYFMQDGIHLYDAGNRKIAELLYGCFEENGLVELLIEP